MRIQKGEPLQLIDMNSGFVPSDYVPDGVHLGIEGYVKYAQRWYEGIQKLAMP